MMNPAADTFASFSLLGAHLAPVRDLLDDPLVSEIAVNRPGEVWIERAGCAAMERRDQPEWTAERLRLLANAVAAHSHQEISRAKPLLSARLTGGARIQIVGEPVIDKGAALSIRRQVLTRMSLDDFERNGLLSTAKPAGQSGTSGTDAELAALLKEGETRAFLTRAVEARRNIIVSGGTSSGKTTLANALIEVIPTRERLIGIEDARELSPQHANFLSMIASRGGQSESGAHIDATALLEASLRLRPDRILLGELRGAEAYAYLRAINSGHPGSITTLHADTPDGALDQIAFMVLQSGINLRFDDIRAYVRSIIDVIVQLKREGGKRRIEAIWSRSLESNNRA